MTILFDMLGNQSDDEMLPPVVGSSQRKSIKASNQSNVNEILKTYQVNAHKYVDSKYEGRGKIGLALLGSKSTCNFSILLYGKANAALAQASINKDFEVTSTRDLYISFYDAKSENWSILFDTIDIYNDFFNRISILKLAASKQDLVSIDVKIGEGIVAHDSDLCEAEIMIFSIKNCEIVSTLYSSESNDTNKIIRLKIGANKLLPAIDKGIYGMMKGGQRIIAISSQSALLKGGTIKVLNDTGVLINLKVVRIKTKTEKPVLNNESGDTELSLPNLPDYEVKSSKKTDLIQRMRELGQPILKFNVSEDSDHPVSKSPEMGNYVQANTNFVPRPQPASNTSFYENVPHSNQIIPMHASNPIMTAMQQMYQPMQPTIQPIVPDCNLVFTETRQHNTEMRIAISKLQDKIDRIADKIENSSASQRPSIGRHMDAENVFENIKRIIDENEVLKRECSQKSDTIDSQNKRINELLNKSQQYLEESRSVIERSSSTFSTNDSESQRKILKLEEEKLDLIRNLSKKTSELSNLEMKAESLNSESQGYRSKSLEFNEQLDKLTTELGNAKLQNRSLLTEIDKLKEERTAVMVTNEDLIDYKRTASENERKLQNNIESLKNSVRETNVNIEQARKECDNEIAEIRQRCNDEIEQLREKLKQERRLTTSKSNNLETEIEIVNKDWEAKFSELKQAEAVKLTKLNERNGQLLTENSGLNRDIFELKDQLSLASNNEVKKLEELTANNRLLKRQLDDTRSRAEHVDKLRLENDNLEQEIARLTTLSAEIGGLKEELAATVERKRQLESMVKTLTEELNVRPVTENNVPTAPGDVDDKIKGIMNDVFKKIKSEFELSGSYSGKEVNTKCMVIIRDCTVNLIQAKQQQESSDDGSSDSDSGGDDSAEVHNNDQDSLEVDSPLLRADMVNDLVTTVDEPIAEIANDVKYGTEETVESVTQEEIFSAGNFNVIEEPEDVEQSEETKEISGEENVTIIDEKKELDFEKDIFEQLAKVNGEQEMDNGTGNRGDIVTSESSVEDTAEVTKVDDKVEFTSSFHDDQESVKSSQITENVIDEFETKLNSEIISSPTAAANCDDDDAAAAKVKEKDPIFSSDEEDDISGFFEKLNQKKIAKVEQSKPVSSEIDDELSWLHS